MKLLLDSLLRAVAYCFHPRVVALSMLPLVLMVALALGLGYFFWEPALQVARQLLEASSLLNTVWDWLEKWGVGGVKGVLAPLMVIFAITPAIVLACLLAVSLLMTPALTRLVAARRFPGLERRHGASFLGALAWSLGSSLLALAALIVSMPLWLVPPLVLVLPALIWGWLTYRVLAFDALAEHASVQERRQIFLENRSSLLTIGVICGFMGAAPSVIWASGALFAAAFVILVPLAVWLYTLVFALSSLWFAHYALAALEALRARPLAQATVSPVPASTEAAVTWQDDTSPRP